ncbi:MAG: acyl-[Clostridia bacterium]|nr:acyl-[acyl-carrier-protein] thioesterase [Clostridia bacterium]
MRERYTRQITILPSQIDAFGKLSVPETFDLFMDVATEAAEEIGVGMGFLQKKGMFWITVKTRVRFLKRPGILDTVELATWPERPVGKRCNRYYEISSGGEPLVQGKTEWAIVSVLTRRTQNLEKLMPVELAYPDGPICEEPFPMIDEAFEGASFAEHIVKAVDIDLARHMNNVAYVRAIVNAFSIKEWKKLDVQQMDVIFRSSAHEGDVLRFRKRRQGNVMDICGSLPDGTTSVLARLTLG